MHKSFASMLLILALAGCASAPPSAEQPIIGGTAAASSVVLCQTTFAELEERLGVPSRDGVVGKDRVVTWIVEWDPLVRYLGVILDSRGVVVDRYWNAPSEIQWVPTNRCKSG
jgi:hypothetical protein